MLSCKSTFCKSALLFRAALLVAAIAPVAAQAQFGDQEATPPILVIIRGNGTASSSTPTGTTPAQMLTAYGFTAIPNKGAGQTIGIVDAFDDPNIEADLGVFSAQFGLPACTTSNKCFTKVFANGNQPSGNTGWGTEMSLDVEWAHAIFTRRQDFTGRGRIRQQHATSSPRWTLLLRMAPAS